ncbi:MAG: hypothetical protein K9K75_01645, partial [Deltaproteobacteria bacterium]|nr:hypothetical protein [Deltaproteobacteria bacterium]
MLPKSHRLKKTVTIIAVLVFFGVLSSCSATGAFRSYPRYMNPVITSLEYKRQMDMEKTFDSGLSSADAILYNMEYARIAQLLGNFSQSKRAFFTAMEITAKNDQKALISASALGANMAAIMTNDGAIPYSAAGYERVMTHHYQALNFLAA